MLNRSRVCLWVGFIVTGAACSSAHDPGAAMTEPSCDAELACPARDAQDAHEVDDADAGSPWVGDTRSYASCEGVVTSPDFSIVRERLRPPERTDADCAQGLGCSPSRSVTCFNLARASTYVCHTPEDACRTDAECEGGACVFDPARSHWRCTDEQCLVP